MLMLAGEEAELGRARPRPLLSLEGQDSSPTAAPVTDCHVGQHAGEELPSQAAFVFVPFEADIAGLRREKLDTKTVVP